MGLIIYEAIPHEVFQRGWHEENGTLWLIEYSRMASGRGIEVYGGEKKIVGEFHEGGTGIIYYVKIVPREGTMIKINEWWTDYRDGRYIRCKYSKTYKFVNGKWTKITETPVDCR